MSDFDKAYAELNKQQKLAVDNIDGPLLVLAGPGTGKTQLLSARTANILKKTDTAASNILCLTFTESGAENMRERLTRFIGGDAQKVHISTYHGFGSEIIARNSEYFIKTRLEKPADELIRYQIISELVENMSYLNPLKVSDDNIKDLISTISDLKRSLISSENLRKIADDNLDFCNKTNDILSETLDFSTMPRYLDTALEYFERLLENLNKFPKYEAVGKILPLSQLATQDLEGAINDAKELNKTTPLTEWKNKWLLKNNNDQFIIGKSIEHKRLHALADLVDGYQNELSRGGYYDFDDMILRSIEALENYDDLKYSLQEQYLYILLDEFQDTNPAQFKLVQLLSDNPVNEGRPNVMAVGDDDQAIYSFQGANYSNMLDFYNSYTDVKLVNLSINYRSEPEIIQIAKNVSSQIEENLANSIKGLSKNLEPARKSSGSAMIDRVELTSDIGELTWTANRIKALVDAGVEPKDIAVLTKKHKQLEALLPYLKKHSLPIYYEKRENVLDSEIIKSLLLMSKLVINLNEQDVGKSNALWPEVLSLDVFKIPTEKIWRMSWHRSEKRLKNWAELALNDDQIKPIALMLLSIASKVDLESYEKILDMLTGNETIKLNDDEIKEINSPLKSYYFDIGSSKRDPEQFYRAISHLSIIRETIREYQTNKENVLTIKDFLEFIEINKRAGQQILDTNPYRSNANAINLMTVFKAKGLEFKNVFLPSLHDDIWGKSSKNKNNAIGLPHNLKPIRHAGDTEDEKLRALFVALTRAEEGLYLSSYERNYRGKQSKRLAYLSEHEDEAGKLISDILPTTFNEILKIEESEPSLEELELNWRHKHIATAKNADLQQLLSDKIKNFRISPTHLNNFYDLEYNGPESFFFNNLLRFPQAPSSSNEYGNAVHLTLEWVQLQVQTNQKIPTNEQIEERFEKFIGGRYLKPSEIEKLAEQGKHELLIYINNNQIMFKPTNRAEYDFRTDNVNIGGVPVTGKIDFLEVDAKKKQIVVVDYKTGKYYDKWKGSDLKHHKFKQQLNFYKLLLENSFKFKGYKVVGARIEFIKPDDDGKSYSLQLEFDDKAIERTMKLLKVMWQHVQELNFPSTENYSPDYKGSKQFEDDLL
jgi:DNA helicase II / ATP-dependent DNA helicase PcrA